MKKQLILLGLFSIFSTTVFLSCNDDDSDNTEKIENKSDNLFSNQKFTVCMLSK
ncbi:MULTISPECIES: hypothetical protein [Empedobacter]|uniref:hypothetical protein n=1 Tax=Empedobacter TaxID=59734 RepID=UPI00289DA928|nr:hypothetical protein [Empedobacter sp.]